jgi:hypothetical protein
MPTAEEANAINAAWNAAQAAGIPYTPPKSAAQDAADEYAKHQAAFSQPRNDLDFAHSSNYDAIVAQYNAQKYYSVGSSGLTYQPTGGPKIPTIENPQNAAQIAYNVAVGGGNLGREVIEKSQAWGFDPTPYVNRPVQQQVATRQDIPQYDRVGNPLNSMAAQEQAYRNALNPYGRAGYTNPDTLGDINTQRMMEAAERVRPALAGLGYTLPSPTAMEGTVLSAQLDRAIGTPGTRDDQFFNTELQKWGQNFVERSSEYHHTAMRSGVPVPANPFEYQGDLAVEFLKGAPNPLKSSEWFSPVSGEMGANLPGGRGLQQAAWETAKTGVHGVSFSDAVRYINSKEGQYGPYGKLWGGPDYEETGHNAPQFAGARPAGDLVTTQQRWLSSGPEVTMDYPAPFESTIASATQTTRPQSTPSSYFQELRSGIANLPGLGGVSLGLVDIAIPVIGLGKIQSGATQEIFKGAYNLGESVPSSTVNKIASSFSGMSTLDTAKIGGAPAQILGNIYKGGSTFEAFADYSRISSAVEKKASPMITQYESDLAKYNTELGKYTAATAEYESKLSAYNTALEAYNQNKTQEGYNKLKSMQSDLEASKPDQAYANLSAMKSNLDVQKSVIDSALMPSELAKQSYGKQAAQLTGNIDQKTLLTYGLGTAIGDVGQRYQASVENPIRSFVAPAGEVGGFISGLASVPTQVATIVQSGLIGGETILRDTGNLPGLATAGLAMQAKGTYELGTTHPGELLGTLVGMALLGEGVRAGYGRVRGIAVTRGMDYVPVEDIGYDVNQGFAIGRPTERGLVESFGRGTLEPAPQRMSLTNQPPEYIPGEVKYNVESKPTPMGSDYSYLNIPARSNLPHAIDSQLPAQMQFGFLKTTPEARVVVLKNNAPVSIASYSVNPTTNYLNIGEMVSFEKGAGTQTILAFNEIAFEGGMPKITAKPVSGVEGFYIKTGFSPKSGGVFERRISSVETKTIASSRPGARLPNAQPGDVTLWTAHEYNTLSRGVGVGEAYRVATPGSSEVYGVYGASTLMSYFTKVGGQIPRMIGLDTPFKSPTIYSSTVDAVEAVSRRASMEAMARPRDYTLMNMEIQAAAAERPTVAFLPLAKSEYEAVIAQNAVVEVTGRQYYTKLGGFGQSHFLGTRVPIVEQRLIGFEPGDITPGLTTRESSSSMKPRPLISQFGLSFGASSAAPIQYPSGSYKAGTVSPYGESTRISSIAREAYSYGGSSASERGASSRSPLASQSYSRASGISPTEYTALSSLVSESPASSLISTPYSVSGYSPSSLITTPIVSRYTLPYSPLTPTYIYEPSVVTPPTTPTRPTYVPTPPIITEVPPPAFSYGWLPGSGGGGGGRRPRRRRKVELFSFEEGLTTPIPARYGLGGRTTRFVPGYRGIARDILRPSEYAPNPLSDILGTYRGNRL